MNSFPFIRIAICVSAACSTAAFAQQATYGTLTIKTTTNVRQAPVLPAGVTSAIPRHRSFMAVKPQPVTNLAEAAGTLTVPHPTPKNVSGPGPGSKVFNGMNELAQETANYNPFAYIVEPPDQGLAVNGSYVVELVNDAVAIYTPAGSLVMPPFALSALFGLPPELTGNPPTSFGPSLSDPRGYFDVGTQRWFFTVLEFGIDPTTGANTGRAYLNIAVSQSTDPTAAYTVYTLDVTDDGTNGTPSHPNCPCFGDQPLLGANADGFFISTNEFGLFSSGFNGANIYAFSKNLLATLQPNIPVVLFSGLPLAEGTAYSVQPATRPDAGSTHVFGGVEYFMSALQFSGTLDNRIAVWAMTNTSSLINPQPTVKLQNTVIQSETYGQPNNAQQRPGPTPLGTSLGEPLTFIDSNDDRMQQVVFANGLLWSGLNTIVAGPNQTSLVGAAYFGVKPVLSNTGVLSATIANQGYVTVVGNNVMYPSVGVNTSGKGVIAYTLVGPTFFPSLGYSLINASLPAGNVHIIAQGSAPEDGFSGYPAYGGSGSARWGDYSAAVADGMGNIWFAGEYIPIGPRSTLANWGTAIGMIPAANAAQ